MTAPSFANDTWQALASAADPPTVQFDPRSLDGLPPPARRLLRRSLPAGTALSTHVELEMAGEIKLGRRWLDFTARQFIRAGVGFVWMPVVVGGRLLRFTGADALGSDGARVEFRLFGRIPLVRASGVDIDRSAAGRLAAETVAWVPQALTPQLHAQWEPIDDRCAAVTLEAAGRGVRVEVSVSDDGELEWLGLQRWKDSAKPPAYAPFGGSVASTFVQTNGIRIAGAGRVGWEWHAPEQAGGEFFRYRIVRANSETSPSRGATST